jgi:sortase (surface protein transpeptidase)
LDSYTFETEGSEDVVESIDETGISIEPYSNSAEIPVIRSFFVEIPKIDLKKAITPNVDPSNKDEYMDVIEESVAHGMYTALPYIQNGNTYLFAHSKISENNGTPEGGWFTRIDELEDHNSLTLQTCWPRGTTEKRLIVQAISE